MRNQMKGGTHPPRRQTTQTNYADKLRRQPA